ncbi:MAG: ATP-binding protein [Alphaproteobacteria bacterium]|nr:ATP-binding protein [Alphaproteobacteria bacterium]
MDAFEAASGRLSHQLWRSYVSFIILGMLLMGGRLYMAQVARENTLLANTAKFEQMLISDSYEFTVELAERLHTYDVVARMGEFVTAGLLSGNSQLYESALFRVKSIIRKPGGLQFNSDIVQVAVMDPKGIVLWGTEGGVGIDLSDRENYRAIATSQREWFIGRPVVGRITGKLTLQYSKAMLENDKLISITVVSIDAAVVEVALRSRPFIPLKPLVHRHVLRDDGITLGVSNAKAQLVDLPIDTIKSKRSLTLRAVDNNGQHFLVAAKFDDRTGLIVASAAAETDVENAATAELEQGTIITYYFLGVVVILVHIAWQLQALYLRHVRDRTKLAVTANSFKRLRELAENCQETVIIWRLGPDRNTIIEYVSPQSFVELGMDAAELLDNPTAFYSCFGDPQLLQARLETLLLGQETSNLEYRFSPPGGSPRWIVVNSRPIGSVIEGDKSFHRFITCLSNVTRYHELQDRLMLANARLERLTSDSPCVLYQIEVAIVDGALSVPSTPYFSRSILRQSGYTSEEFAAPDPLHRRVSPEAVAARMDMLARALRDGEASSDYQIRRADGRLMWVRDLVRVSERLVGSSFLTGFIIDVTTEKQFSDVLDENSKLASLGEMAASIAHELHQPLAAISLNVEMIALDMPADTPLATRIHVRLDKIQRLVDRSANVIRYIREFSRVEDEVPTAIDLHAAIAAVADIMSSRVRQSGCVIEIAARSHDEDGSMNVLGQVGRFEQVIMNLVGNAVDAYGSRPDMGTAARIIEIAARATSGAIEITISDHAGGIPPALISRIFEPFFTTKEVSKGTGLGLSICRRIINEMGGRLNAANYDGGAAFTISLPPAPPPKGAATSNLQGGNP